MLREEPVVAREMLQQMLHTMVHWGRAPLHQLLALLNGQVVTGLLAQALQVVEAVEAVQERLLLVVTLAEQQKVLHLVVGVMEVTVQAVQQVQALHLVVEVVVLKLAAMYGYQAVMVATVKLLLPILL
jgi:hypothetical protein